MDKEDIFDLLVATNKEKPATADINKLKQHLIKHPEHSATLGNLAGQVQEHIIKTTYSHSAAMEISLKEYCEQQRKDFGYEYATALERPLIECVVLCWLRLHTCELEYGMHLKGVSFAQALYWEKKLSATHQRYLRAVEALARVRRLLKEPRSPVLNMLLAQQFNQR